MAEIRHDDYDAWLATHHNLDRFAAKLKPGQTVAVNETLRLERLARDFSLAESHLHTWLYKSRPITRSWGRMRHHPLGKNAVGTAGPQLSEWNVN